MKYIILIASGLTCNILLYFAIFCYILLYFAIPCYILLYFGILGYTLPYLAILGYTWLSFAILCYTLLYFAISYYILLYFAIIWGLNPPHIIFTWIQAKFLISDFPILISDFPFDIRLPFDIGLACHRSITRILSFLLEFKQNFDIGLPFSFYLNSSKILNSDLPFTDRLLGSWRSKIKS